MHIPVLETPRLRLRSLRESDLEAYTKMLSHKDVVMHIGDGQPASKKDAWFSMAMNLGHWKLKGYGRWAVEEKETGRFVGRVGLYHPYGWPGMEVSYALDRDFWGRGYAVEAATSAVRWGFEHLTVTEILCCTHPTNKRSCKTAEQLGFSFKEKTIVHGQAMRIYAISRAQWKS